ncbi:MAG: nicotinate phosphoribosyltransferase [Firmicutes bacterium]|nr:nicotinate phosphoribosyltransferase [Bacillota bacterium]
MTKTKNSPIMHQRNLSMMTDLYQLTMMNGYFLSGSYKNIATFDMFFRHKGQLNYAIFAGLEQAIDYIKNLAFTSQDIDYLASLNIFDKEFLKYLANFKFTGSLYSCEEGEIVFPYEPILIVKAPLIEAQLIETALLNIISHQTLIATKASKIVQAAKSKSVIEFGLRRAQGPDAAVYGSRAAIIGGCNGTSNVLAGQLFDLDIKGTHAHSWVLSHNTELEAFENFANSYPDSCLLLIDTYDTLNSGLINAIKVFNDLKAKGHKPIGIRLDSGDLAYLSKKCRQALDCAGFNDCIIFASGDIDEKVISSLEAQDAKIDVYGVGTKLITSQDTPSLGGVYKLASINISGIEHPKIKISNSLDRMTNPGLKKVYRLYDKDGMAKADYIALENEEINSPLILKHETDVWKKLILKDFTKRELLLPIFKNGKQAYQLKSINQHAKKAKFELNKFWEEYKRVDTPQIYKVNLSQELINLKKSLLGKNGYEI